MTDDTVHSNDDTSATDSPVGGEEWRIILNPASGTRDHAADVRSRAADRGYTVRETETEGDAVAFGKEAASENVNRLAVCGGDGTVHQVVHGVGQTGSLSDVTFAVIPGGTGNNFARNLGVRSVEHAFALLETGERRRIDVGMAEDEPFVNSCIAGITAQTSSETAPELKERFGTLAYVITGLRQATEFDPLGVEIDTGPTEDSGTTDESGTTEESTWRGDALCILVGNGRRFAGESGQANAEDGLFEVTIVEEMPANDLLTEAAIHRLFGGETEHVTRFASESLELTSRQDDDIVFSLDGEIRTHRRLSLRVLPRELEIVVGSGYSPDPG